jgi:NAD(P)-dependent dehydrogenase (short-subunit alcohol dehydrogenase family)
VRKVADEIIAAGASPRRRSRCLDKGSIEAQLEDVAARPAARHQPQRDQHSRSPAGTPLVEMTLENFTAPIVVGASTHFTATAAARHMMKRGSGVILTSPRPAPRSGATRCSTARRVRVACSTIESLSRTLAGQLGPKGIRVVCLR